MKGTNIQRYKFIGEYLIEAGLLTEAQVRVALKDQHTTSMAFGEIIATRGWVKSQTIEYLVTKIIEPERQFHKQESLASAMARQPRKASRSSGHPSSDNQQKPGKQNPGVNWIG